jgi:hypothetical protein
MATAAIFVRIDFFIGVLFRAALTGRGPALSLALPVPESPNGVWALEINGLLRQPCLPQLVCR